MVVAGGQADAFTFIAEGERVNELKPNDLSYVEMLEANDQTSSSNDPNLSSIRVQVAVI